MNIIQILKLVSPICPSVNHYLAYRAIIKNGKPITMSYKTPEAIKYQKKFIKYVQEQVELQGWVKSDNKFQHYYMDCVFYFPRTDMDCNNYFKCLADAITQSGVVWIDDNQLCERVQRIYYCPDNPRIEIEIRPVNYIGVFENADQLEEFESNCIDCIYYNRNCSILVKSKEGRIQDEIQNFKCTKFKCKK